MDTITTQLKPSYVYVIREQGTDFYKIGFTTDIQARIAGLQTSNPRKLAYAKVWEGTKRSEGFLHALYEHLWQNGEWFRLSSSDIAQMEKIVRYMEWKPVAVPAALVQSKADSLREWEHGTTVRFPFCSDDLPPIPAPVEGEMRWLAGRVPIINGRAKIRKRAILYKSGKWEKVTAYSAQGASIVVSIASLSASATAWISTGTNSKVLFNYLNRALAALPEAEADKKVNEVREWVLSL